MDKSGYCVIEVFDPPYTDFEKYISVPSSWVSLQKTPTGDAAVVKYPIEHLSVTKKRIRKREECSADWNTFKVNIIYSTVSYELAQKFIKLYKTKGVSLDKNYAKNYKDEVASSSPFNKITPKTIPSQNINIPNPFVALSCDDVLRPSVNQTIFKKKNKMPFKKQIKVNESINSANITNYFTRQARKTTLLPAVTAISLHQNNETQTRSEKQSNDCIEQHANCNNSAESSESILSPALGLPNDPIYLKRLVDSLKKINAEHLEFCTIVDEIRNSCGENYALLESMINLLVTFNHLSNFAILPAKKVVSEAAKEKPNETFEMDTLKKTVANIPKEQHEKKINHRMEETMDANEHDANDSDKNETASFNNGHQIHKFTLPKEYDKNNSRWTLKHLQKKKGLVELLPNSGVYVDAIRLSNCKRISKDSKMLARMLLVEVFSENALRTCSLTGKRANAFHPDEKDIRPGLDEHAKNVLLNFVEEFANENNWVKTSNLFICNSLRSKLQEMRSKARKESQKQIK